MHTAIFLFFAGALGGALNAVAGSGSFVSFPALLFTGVPAIPANATNTLALWVGTTASGGLGGAFLLIRTPAQTFLHVLPWLLLGATLLFAFGKHLTGRISAGITHEASSRAVTVASIYELFVAVYGGYFGGGVGIMNLAMLAAVGMADIHAMNKRKVMLGGVINGVATIAFIAARTIVWPQAIVMTAGSILGGYSSAHFSQKLPQAWVKAFVILVGMAMTIYFFIRAYR